MKKMMSVLLALALLLTPMFAMAQEATAFDNALAAGKTLKASLSVLIDESLTDAQTAEMLANMSFDVTFATEPAAQVCFSLVNGEATMGDLMIEVGENEDLYIRSTLLGDQIIRVDVKDSEALLDKSLAFLVSIGMMTQEEADTFRQEMMAAGEEQMTETETAEEPAQEEAITISMFELMAMDYGPLMDAVVALAEKVQYTTDTHAPENADPAAEYYGIDLTGEDIAALADGVMKMIYSSKTLTAMMGDAQISEEELALVCSIVKSLGVGVYLDKDGALVHMTLLPVIATADGDYVGSVSYSRKTEEGKMTFALDLGLALDPVEGEYTVLFNIPAALILEENRMALTADVLDYKAEAAIELVETEEDAGTHNEINATLTVTDPAGESLKGKLQFTWNECLPTEEYPTQGYVTAFSLNDEEPLVGVMVMVSAIDPTGEALAAQEYVQPAQMTQEEFNAFAEELLMQIGQMMEIDEAA